MREFGSTQRFALLAVLTCLFPLLLLSCGGATLQPPPASGFKLVWSDEFNGADGSSPDASKWTYDTGVGGNGWGNNELETYADPSDGVTRNYTSARLKTQGLFSQAYGRFEARIKISEGQGMWPAFWMLGNNITSVGWPKCAEID